jgi:hypothetical protein
LGLLDGLVRIVLVVRCSWRKGCFVEGIVIGFVIVVVVVVDRC